VQGDERDIIIFTTAYAKNTAGKMVRNYGWLNQVGGENRLNVAVTRSKQKIYLVTSIRPLEFNVEGLTNDGPKIFRRYLEYAYAISAGDEEGALAAVSAFGGEEDSAFGLSSASGKERATAANALAEVLEKKGLLVERGVGVGGYKLDLAVKNEAGKYILGIEVDTSLYNGTGGKGISRERDLHRYKYLAARGWKVHRVFSAKFDAEREADKVIEAAGGKPSVRI
jgi:very-short-patch-repair endonuclease